MEKQNENLVHFGVNLIDTIRVSELRANIFVLVRLFTTNTKRWKTQI